MGRIELRHSEFPVPLAKGPHISGPYGYDSAFKGSPIWFIAGIDSVDEYHEITFGASFKYEPSATNTNEHRHKSRIGIWTAVKDSPSVVTIASQNDEYIHGESDNFKLVLDEWRFGKDAQIVFQVNNKSAFSKIKLALCAVPVFQADDGNGAATEVTLTLQGKEKGDMHDTKIEEKRVIFKRDDDAKQILTRTEITLLN